MKAITKKQINLELKPIKEIYQGKIPGRYTGLTQSDCTTKAQIEFYNVVRDPNFEYKTLKDQVNEVYKRLGLNIGESKKFEKIVNGVIIRNLPANDKYTFLLSGSFAEGEGWFCENCGRYIVHWNEVESSKTKNKHMIGSECINTVLKYDLSEDWNAIQLISEANKRKSKRQKINKILKEGGTVKIEGDYHCIYKNNNLCGNVHKDDWKLMYRTGITKQSNK